MRLRTLVFCSEEEPDRTSVNEVARDPDPLRHAVGDEGVPDVRTGVTRQAEVEKEFADVESHAAHDADVVVEIHLQQFRGAVPLGVGHAELGAAEEPQGPELETQLQRDFEPLRTQRDAAGAGAFGADRVIDECEIKLRLQVQAAGEVEPQDEARLIVRLGGTGPESVFSDFHTGKRCGWWW